MKKLYILSILIYFLSQSNLLAAASEKYIIWLRDSKADSTFIDTLQRHNFKVIVRTTIWQQDSSKAVTDSLNNAALVIMSRNCGSLNYVSATRFNSITAPLVCLGPWLIRANRWVWVNFSNSAGYKAPATVKMEQPGDPILEGIKYPTGGKMEIYKKGNGSDFLPSFVDVGNGTPILTDSVGTSLIAARWDAGVQFYTGCGQTAGGDRIYFSAGESNNDGSLAGGYNLNALGTKIFLNLVNQYAGGGAASIRDNANKIFNVTVNNPISDFANIKINGNGLETANITLTDISGRIVFVKNYEVLNSATINLNLSNYTSGLYLLKVSAGDKHISKKIIKQ